LVVRVALAILLHDRAFIYDHLNYVYWGQLALDRGPLALYVPPAERERPEHTPYRMYSGSNAYADRLLAPQAPIPMSSAPRPLNLQFPDGGTLGVTIPAGHGQFRYALYRPSYFNYPPLAAYLYWGLGWLHRTLDPAQSPDTRLAHLLFAAPAILCDLGLALLVAWALRDLGGELSPTAGALLIVFSPALIWDSSVWLQTDSTAATMIVATVWFLARRRPVGASALCAAGLLLKPQVLWVAPLCAYAALRVRSLRTIVASILAAAAVVVIGSIPFVLDSGLRWFEASYLHNLGLMHGLTLQAYNPWWIVALLRGALAPFGPTAGAVVHPSPVAWMSPLFDDRVAWMWGLSPRVVGLLMFALAAIVSAVVWRRRTGGDESALFVLAYLVYVAAFLFPAEVHERYIVYSLPLAVVAAARVRPIRLTLWALNLLALMNVMGYVLFDLPVDQTSFSTADWIEAAVLCAAAASTVVVFALPLLTPWSTRTDTNAGFVSSRV
jgi:hypothetical protein